MRNENIYNFFIDGFKSSFLDHHVKIMNDMQAMQEDLILLINKNNPEQFFHKIQVFV